MHTSPSLDTDASPAPSPSPTAEETAASQPPDPPAKRPTPEPPGPCSELSLSASPESPQPPGTSITFTASVSGCASPTVDFWLTDPSGVGLLVQGPGDRTAWVFATTYGTAADTWTITAHAQGASGTPPVTGSIEYTLGSPPPPVPCTSLSVSASPQSPQPRGTAVAFTASVASCASPIYRFWLTDTIGVGTLLQDWSSSGTYTWATSPAMIPGAYRIRVDARDATDASIEQSVTVSYPLT